jgi:hypothetical protein
MFLNRFVPPARFLSEWSSQCAAGEAGSRALDIDVKLAEALPIEKIAALK